MTKIELETPVLVVWRNRSLETRPNARAYETLFTPDDPARTLAFTIRYIAETKFGTCEVVENESYVFSYLDRSTAQRPMLIPVSCARDALGWANKHKIIDITDSEALLPPHPDGIGGFRAVS